MRLAEPAVLWGLAGIPLLAAFLGVAIARRRRALAALADQRLLGRIVTAPGAERHLLRAALACAAAALLLAALARPQWGSTLDPVSRRGVDVVLAVDVSLSMLAEDLRPSRLEKARSEAARLAEALHGDRIAVVAFAGSAATVCPLTLDHAAARLFLDALSPDLLSEPGTSLALAVRQAASVFGGAERRFKAAVIFSDGEDHQGEIEEAAAEAAEQGLVIHTVGVGTPAGGPIPLRDEQGAVQEYKQDREGRVVTSRLEEAGLAAVAERTGGLYLPATPAEGEIERIAEAIGSMDKREMQQRLLTRYEERFQVPLALALALLAAGAAIPARRRPGGSAARVRRAAAVLAVVLAAAAPASAASAPSLVEEGNQAFREGRYDDALRLYTQAQVERPDSPELDLNVGNVFFRKGEFDKAREAYRRAFAARDARLAQSARYNSGTAGLAARSLEEAVADFKEALKLDPGDADARRNLELALQRLRQMKPPEARPQQRPDGKEGDEKKDQQERAGGGPEEDEKKPDQSSGPPGEAAGQGEEPPRKAPQAAGRREKQEAEQILDALRREDRPRLGSREQRGADRPPEKDW